MRYKRYTLADLEKSASRKRFNVVSFFAGGGGSSCGYKLAGGDMICVNEFQQVHADTYSANFPNTPVIVDDIKKLSGEQIREKIGNVEIDILDGSPPCPPFSMSGTKQKGWGKEKMAYGFKQERIEDLTFEQIRIVGELKPKVVVCENVKGLTMEYAREYLNMMISEFERQGYTTDFQVLNSWQFGVPQKRERVFIVSVRNDVADKIGINFLNFKSMIYPVPSDENKPLIEDAIRDIQDDGFHGPKSPDRADSAVFGFTELFPGLVRSESDSEWQPPEVMANSNHASQYANRGLPGRGRR